MLGKLIKYEFKASGRLIPIIYAIVVLLAVAGAILSAAKMYIYVTMSFVLLFLAGAAALIITYVVVFLRFYRGMFGAEGYLAMTLPVTSTQLYLSKTIVAFVWLLLSSVVTIASWLSAFASLFSFTFAEVYQQEIPPYAMQELYEALGLLFHPGVMTLYIVLALVGYLSFTAQVYFCVTIANVRPFQGMGIAAAILAYVVLQIITQIINTILTLNIPFALAFDSTTGWHLSRTSMWDSMNNLYSADFSMGLGAYLIPILSAFVLPILTIRLIDRRVNLK